MGKKLEVKRGDRYGMLTVIEEVKPHITPSGYKVRMIKCQCECGNTTIVNLNDLRMGNTSSCGCLRKQRISVANSKTKTKTNEYDMSGKVGVGYTSNGERFLFDKEDFELIKNYCWCINDYGYVVTIDRITRKTVQLHRLVMHPKEDELIDHINRNRLDNRKANLRVCSYSENAKNRSSKKDSLSGVTGVSWHKLTSKWAASIKVNGKSIHLGTFTNINEAIRVRIHSELEIFGEYAPTYNYFTREQRQAILNDEMSSEEMVKILNQKGIDKQYSTCYNKDR